MIEHFNLGEFHAGFIWRSNPVQCFYEILPIFENNDPDYPELWDCWVQTEDGRFIHYSKHEIKKTQIYLTPDEALFALFKSDNFSLENYLEIQNELYSIHKENKTEFIFSRDYIYKKLYDYNNVQDFSDFVEHHFNEVLELFQF